MSGPKVLSFDNIPPVRKEKKSSGPSALNFPAAAHVPAKPAPKVAAVPGKALFNTADTNLVSAAVEYAKQNFSNITKTEEQRVERQIRQLLPVQYDTMSMWGSSTLDEGVQFTTQSARLIKQFSELRANELTENALAAAQTTPGLLNKFFQREKSVLQYKPNLIAAKSQLSQFLPLCEELIDKSVKLELRATINLVALSSVCNAIALPQDDATLINASQNRRVILQQAAQQYKLLSLQLDSIRQQISDQLATVEQVLTITIPAFEVSNAHK